MQNAHGGQPFQITRVWARNFRSIADATVDLDRLTVLVGPNASGKSNILDILRFIKDAFRFDLDAAISLRHGIAAIQRLGGTGHSADIELGLEAREGDGADSYTLEYGFILRGEVDGEFRVKQEYARVWTEPVADPVEFKVEDGHLTHPRWLVTANGRRRSLPGAETGDGGMSDLWLPRMARGWRYRGWVGSEEQERVLRQGFRALEHFRQRLQGTRFYHISPNTVREPQKCLGNTCPLDEDASNLASVLRITERRGPGGIPHFQDSLSHLIPGVSDLEVTAAGGYLVVRLKHETSQGGTWMDLAQASDGTIRLLGLLAALYQGWHLPLIGIEEPELTVHPGALAILADLLKEAKERSQVMVTTHSPDLIDCLSNYRAMESLRIVELREGVTAVGKVASTQMEDIRQSLFSLGELHRMGELALSHEDTHG